MEIQLKKVHTGKDLAISGLLFAAGIGLYFVNAGLGIVLALCGAAMLLLWKTGYKHDSDGPVLTKAALDVAHSCRQGLKDYLEGKDADPKLTQPGTNEGVVRMEIYYNKAAGVAYAQLFDFSSYEYEPATQLVELHSPRADKLLKEL